MSTPTPNKHPASQQGRTPSQLTGATPPVSTPFSNAAQAAFSPRGPRSSPQQVKKSPAASMLGQLSNSALAFDSPSTAAALGLAGPADLAPDHDPADELRDMRPITRDDDKLNRLETILGILNRKKGLVSEAGLERLAQRLGLDCLAEDFAGPSGQKMRALIIAGSSTQIDIILDNNIVQNVTLAFPQSSESTSKHMEAASKILLDDLWLPPNQSPLTKTLDKFAFNLERLAAWDKLSMMPTFDCRAVLAGVFTSLERLYQWDVAKLREEGVKSEKLLPLLAMCTKHGLPTMHARARVGLALQYWKERRLIPPETKETAAYSEDREKKWTLVIGCAAMDGLQAVPVRMSENWISKDIVKDDGLGGDPTGFPLDWQEPENVSLPASDEAKHVGIEIMQPDLSTVRVPPVMFTVTFDPPVVLPQSDWMRLYGCANLEPPPPPPRPPTFDQLYFPIPPGVHHDPSEKRTIERLRQVSVLDQDGNRTEKTHHNTLFIYKQIYSMEVTEMVFSHPKQLISMLPLLRQWAFTSTILENSFGSKTQVTDENAAANGGLGAQTTSSKAARGKDDLAAFMQSSDTDVEMGDAEEHTSESELRVDIIVWVHPTPHFQVVFPFKNSKASITLQILENGIVEVVDENVLSSEEGDEAKDKKCTRSTLGKALEHMEDLCQWAEWIRSRLS